MQNKPQTKYHSKIPTSPHSTATVETATTLVTQSIILPNSSDTPRRMHGLPHHLYTEHCLQLNRIQTCLNATHILVIHWFNDVECSRQ